MRISDTVIDLGGKFVIDPDGHNIEAACPNQSECLTPPVPPVEMRLLNETIFA